MQGFAAQAQAISTHLPIISRKGKKKSRNNKTSFTNKRKCRIFYRWQETLELFRIILRLNLP